MTSTNLFLTILLIFKVILITRGDCNVSPYSLSCCTSASPCKENEGGCYYDEECIGDLICGQGDGKGEGSCPSKYPGYFDCCGKGKYRSPNEFAMRATIK